MRGQGNQDLLEVATNLHPALPHPPCWFAPLYPRRPFVFPPSFPCLALPPSLSPLPLSIPPFFPLAVNDFRGGDKIA